MDEHSEGEPRRVGEVAAERLRRLGKATAVSTGFDELDRMAGGFHRSDLILVAGRPSMGKTALMLNIAERVTRDQDASQPVLYVSLETPAEVLVGRLLAAITGMGRRTLYGSPTARERESLEKGGAELNGRALLIDDRAATAAEIRESALAASQAGDLRLLFVDALQVVRPHAKRTDRGAELEEVAWSLKALARELRCPVVASCYLNRGPERRADRRPCLSDLRGSAALEDAADQVLLLYRNDVYCEESILPETTEVATAKNRNGPCTGMESVWLTYREDIDRVESAPTTSLGPRPSR